MPLPGTLLMTASDRAEADIVVMLLEDQGIPCMVHADDAGSMNPALAFTGSVQVFVAENDAARALGVLQAARVMGARLAEASVDPEFPE